MPNSRRVNRRTNLIPRRLIGVAAALLFVLCGGVLLSCSKRADQSHSSYLPKIVLYTLDALVSEDGLGPVVFPEFEKDCGCRIEAVPFGDARSLVQKLKEEAEAKQIKAHVVLGLDQNSWYQAKPYIEKWKRWTPFRYDQIIEQARIENGFLPFDYGIYTFIGDIPKLKRLNLKLPTQLSDLLDSDWKKRILLQDPRSAAAGLAFLKFTHEVLGAEVWKFWKKFRNQWLSLMPGWDAAYALFLRGEAPLVWTYQALQAYHENIEKDRGKYLAAVFKEEGHPVQVEGMALVAGSPRTGFQLAKSREFMEFLLSPFVQEKIPEKNWMLPIVKGTPLPPSFKKLPTPKKLHWPKPIQGNGHQTEEKFIQQWVQALSSN